MKRTKIDNIDYETDVASERTTGGITCDNRANNAASSSEQTSAAEGIINDIYNRYNRGLCRFLKRRLDSKDDVEDVAQEVYLRLIRHRKLEDIRPSLALLCTIAANLLKDRDRRMKVRSIHPHMSIGETDVESSDASPEDIVKSREGIEYFETVYRSLNKNCRQAFMLHRFKGYTYGEIAREMGISKSMVQKHISYVLFQLGKKFESYL